VGAVPNGVELLLQPLSRVVVRQHRNAHVHRVHLFDHLVDVLRRRPGVIVDVDDRELRLRHGMLFDNERGLGTVVDDRWWRKFGRLTGPDTNERRARRTLFARLDLHRPRAAPTASASLPTLPCRLLGGYKRTGHQSRKEYEVQASHRNLLRQPYRIRAGKSQVRSQKSEVRSQKSEVRSQKSESEIRMLGTLLASV
jgi:hypothetical protein